MSWTIETLNEEIDAELQALPNDQKARFARIARLIQEHGLQQIREPYVKHLEKGIWEIRLKGRDGISRALYVVRQPKRIILVRVFVKKTQKTPRREIELALKRVKEIT